MSRRPRAGLAFAIAAPPAAWAMQLLAAYLLVSLACAKHVVVPFGLQAVSVVAAGVALAALGTAARDRGDRDGLPGFLALLATLGAALFLCGIVLGLLPGVLAGGCG